MVHAGTVSGSFASVGLFQGITGGLPAVAALPNGISAHRWNLHSTKREPVLKKLVLGWLAQRNEVLAFCQARAAEGGAGAAIVLLRAR